MGEMLPKDLQLAVAEFNFCLALITVLAGAQSVACVEWTAIRLN